MATARKPAPPQKADALGTEVTFEYDGRTYTVPPTSAWDLDAIEAAEEGRAVTFVRSVLGTEQWAAFKSKPRTVADLEGISEALAAAAGLGN